MAALQSIRKRGGLLIAIIGFALFAFVAGDLFKSCEMLGFSKKNMAASMYGDEMKIQDYQDLENSALEWERIQSQTSNLTAEQEASVREQVWQFYQQRNIIEHEASQLGMKLTEAEVERAIMEGQSQALVSFYQACVGPQQYNYQALQELLKQCEDIKTKGQDQGQMEAVYRILKAWEYVEAQIRTELLTSKYMCMLQATELPSPTEQKELTNNLRNQCSLHVAYLPSSAITDQEAKVTDKDIEELYELYKESGFPSVEYSYYGPQVAIRDIAQNQESRDIKYIDVQVTASPADRQALNEKMTEAYEKIVAGESALAAAAGLNNHGGFADIYLSKSVFTYDVQSRLEGMQVGSVLPIYYEGSDNTLNIIKLVGTQEVPENISLRAIPVTGKDEKEIATRADSIYNALTAGADFAEVAKKYGMPADTLNQSVASMIERDQNGRPNSFERIAASMNDQFKEYFTALTTKSVGYHKLTIGGMTQILQIIDRKDFATRYNVAVVKVPIEYSNDTYNKMVNDLNTFISQNATIDEMEKNATKNGYVVNEVPGFTTDHRNINGVTGVGNVVKWIFDENTEEGGISNLFQDLGANRDHLMIVAVSAVNDGKYLPYTNKQVKDGLTPLATAKVKSEAAFKKLSAAKTLADAEKLGASVDTVYNVSMGNPSIDPLVSSAASRLKVGETTKVKALSGAYMIKLEAKETVSEDHGSVQQGKYAAQNRNGQAFGRNLSKVLFRNAKIVDNRYKF